MADDLSTFRPSRLWRRMSLDRRTEAAELFWADEQSVDQQLEAVASIATRMKFRARSVVALPVEKKGKYLATLPDISDSIAARALVNYHLARQRPMMAAFLDMLGIPHQDGLITEESVTKPDEQQLQRAAHELQGKFPQDDVSLYFATLVSQDPDTWGELAKLTPNF
jgi:hypothetical protein